MFAVAWHVRPPQSQHDLISIHHSQDQCDTHIDTGGSDGDGKNLFSSHSHRGHSAHVTLFIKKKKHPKINALPLTPTNPFMDILRANMYVMLWKAADQQAPPDESARRSGMAPVVALARSTNLCDVIHCEC